MHFHWFTDGRTPSIRTSLDDEAPDHTHTVTINGELRTSSTPIGTGPGHRHLFVVDQRSVETSGGIFDNQSMAAQAAEAAQWRNAWMWFGGGLLTLAVALFVVRKY